MTGPSQAWLNALWNHLASSAESASQYYATAIKMQSLLVMSGNSWVP